MSDPSSSSSSSSSSAPNFRPRLATNASRKRRKSTALGAEAERISALARNPAANHQEILELFLSSVKEIIQQDDDEPSQPSQAQPTTFNSHVDFIQHRQSKPANFEVMLDNFLLALQPKADEQLIALKAVNAELVNAECATNKCRKMASEGLLPKSLQPPKPPSLPASVAAEFLPRYEDLAKTFATSVFALVTQARNAHADVLIAQRNNLISSLRTDLEKFATERIPEDQRRSQSARDLLDRAIFETVESVTQLGDSHKAELHAARLAADQKKAAAVIANSDGKDESMTDVQVPIAEQISKTSEIMVAKSLDAFTSRLSALEKRLNASSQRPPGKQTGQHQQQQQRPQHQQQQRQRPAAPSVAASNSFSPVCRDFLHGHCNRPVCKFLHDSAAAPSPRSSRSPSRTNSQPQSRRNSTGSTHQKSRPPSRDSSPKHFTNTNNNNRRSSANDRPSKTGPPGDRHITFAPSGQNRSQ